MNRKTVIITTNDWVVANGDDNKRDGEHEGADEEHSIEEDRRWSSYSSSKAVWWGVLINKCVCFEEFVNQLFFARAQYLSQLLNCCW